MEVNTTLKAGEIKEIPFEVYMDDEYVPELVTENWSVKGRISVNGESDSHTLSFSAGNLDLQKAQQEAAKVERESAKALSEAKQELDGLKIATDATLRQYFSAAQVESINKCVTTWIGGLIATSNMIRDDSNGVIDGVLKEAGLSGNAMMSAVLGKMGVNENVFTKFSKTAATTKIIATDKNGKNAEIYYSVDLNYNSFKDAPPYAGFGTLDYYIILDNGKKVKAMAKGQVAYTNMDAFADQLQKVAEGSIKAVYNKAWGNNANKVAELIVGKTISSVLNKTVGTFSDNVFTLLKLPSQRSAVKTKTLRASSAPAEESQVEYAKEVTLTGPGDVYVLDAEGKICGAITADTVDSSYNAVHLYANSQEKRIYLTEDDYTIQIVGTETGSMDYTIKEFANGTLLRSIEYKALSLRNGNGYYSTIPDAVYLDNAVYHPVSDTKKVIGAEKDTWQDHMAKQVSTSGLTFDQSKVSLSVGQQLQLNAKVKPDNATNKEVNWTCKNKAVATVSETGLVKGLAEGSTVIQAETADGGFIAECTVTVNKKLPQTITAANITKPYGSKPFPLNAKTSGGGKLTYKSGNPAVATVSSTGMVTAKGPGKAVITISAAATTNYNAATKNITITVTKAKQTITGASSFTKTYGNKPFGLGAKAKTKLTYKSSSTKVARVSSAGKVTLKGPGKATITITAAANGNYNAATKRVAITVKPKKPAAPKVKSTRSRTLKVSWKRDTKATGYQAVIAQNKKFTKGKKTATITKNKTTGKTFKKLKRKKTYYAKVRAYKKVGSTKLYGSYSKVKKVRVR